MQRQTSIHSFFKKPLSEKQSSGGVDRSNSRLASRFPMKHQSENGLAFETSNGTGSSAKKLSIDEIRGTDTPPEKVPLQVFQVDDVDNETQHSVFSSIKHKFLKFNSKNSSDRSQLNGGSTSSLPAASEPVPLEQLNGGHLTTEPLQKQNICGIDGPTDRVLDGCRLAFESDDDVLGPDTPGVRPLVPRMKRVQEDLCSSEDKVGSLSQNTVKRVKFLQDDNAHKKFHHPGSEETKFEWLQTSRIRDAYGRRPDDPLYDKTTLYIPPDALKKMSASQKQYWDIKCRYMDVVLFFKVGKFYELYELDAEIGHKELDWKITLSGVGKCRQVGISESGIDNAVQMLNVRGYKVGRIEQLETSEQAKSRGSASVIQRKLVSVLTPSTTTEDNTGPDAVHLLAIREDCRMVEKNSTAFGFSFVDCAALRFWVGSFSDDASCAALGALLMQISPKEIIFEPRGLSKEAEKALRKYALAGSRASVLTSTQHGADFSDPSEVRKFVQLNGYLKGSCDRWDHIFDKITHHDLAMYALGGLATYLNRLMLHDVLQSGNVQSYQVYKGCLRMDGQTLVNLEIFNNNVDGGQAGTLLKYVDNCITPSGRRLLRRWICHPLKDIEKINQRLDVVDELMSNSEVMAISAQHLRKLPDLERLLGRATIKSSALLLMPLIGCKELKRRVKAFGLLVKGLRTGVDLLLLLHKGGHMSSSLSKVLSLPVLIGDDGLDKFLAQIEAAIDSDFPDYQDHEITDTTGNTLSILMELFLEKTTQLSQIIIALNCLDVLRSFAVTANFSSGAMCRPVILPASSLKTNQGPGGPVLALKGLWHPYALSENGGCHVPNDMNLGGCGEDSHPCTMLLTGPNMGGKSTLLRATCLTVILAQLGSYVPCEVCVLSLVDTIFTRIGASDRIMTGESTFLIECTETASMLQNATQDSLVILDELGRGTSTFDGYAIAYAVFRHLVETVNCRLLFATHYHPLTKEFASHPRVTAQHMACSFKPSTDEHEQLVFLYKLTSGACPEGYGMRVATMAGVPRQVVERASKAAKFMKKTIGESFMTSEQRINFSTLHEEWLKTLLSTCKTEGTEAIAVADDDAFDVFFCLWHELKSSIRLGRGGIELTDVTKFHEGKMEVHSFK